MISQKHKEKLDEKKIRFLNLVSFLFGLACALLSYVLSDYFKLSAGSENVSIFYFVAYVLVLIGLLNLHKLINRFGKYTVFFLLFFLQIAFVFFLIFEKPSAIGIILLTLYLIATNLIWVTLDIILESYSEDKKSGRIRGLYLTIMNSGILLGPFFSTRLLSHFGFDGLFFAAMVAFMLIFVLSLLGLRGANHKFMQQLTSRDLVKKIFVNKDVMKIYGVSLTLEIFYALMIVYTPLYLLDRGLAWNQIGIIFTIMLVPFVFLQYPLGMLADKKFGEKELLITGLLVMGISAGSIFFITSNAIWLWGTILLVTRIGAATIEILRDSYFYKKIDGRDMDVISFFRTACSVGYIVAAATSAVLLFFAPMRYVFLLIALLVLAGLYPAVKLVDNKSEAEM